jgi:hypothetical protein
MAACGLRFSKGKHLISPNKGVFLEKILIFEKRRRFEARGPLSGTLLDFLPLEEQWLLELVKVSQAFPLKGLVSPSFPPGAEKSLPSWWSAGATSWELAKHTGPRRVSLVQRVVKTTLVWAIWVSTVPVRLAVSGCSLLGVLGRR